MGEKSREVFLEVIKNNKSVILEYENDYLSKIIISVKKYKELLGNGVVDSDSILDVESITIIMPSLKQTNILIENGRKYLSEKPEENCVYQTGSFTFYVKEGMKYTQRSLNIQNKKR